MAISETNTLLEADCDTARDQLIEWLNNLESRKARCERGHERHSHLTLVYTHWLEWITSSPDATVWDLGKLGRDDIQGVSVCVDETLASITRRWEKSNAESGYLEDTLDVVWQVRDKMYLAWMHLLKEESEHQVAQSQLITQGQQAAYDQQNGFEQQTPHEQQTGFDQQPSIVQQTPYDQHEQQTGFDQQPGTEQQTGFEQQTSQEQQIPYDYQTAYDMPDAPEQQVSRTEEIALDQLFARLRIGNEMQTAEDGDESPEFPFQHQESTAQSSAMAVQNCEPTAMQIDVGEYTASSQCPQCVNTDAQTRVCSGNFSSPWAFPHQTDSKDMEIDHEVSETASEDMEIDHGISETTSEDMEIDHEISETASEDMEIDHELSKTASEDMEIDHEVDKTASEHTPAVPQTQTTISDARATNNVIGQGRSEAQPDDIMQDDQQDVTVQPPTTLAPASPHQQQPAQPSTTGQPGQSSAQPNQNANAPTSFTLGSNTMTTGTTHAQAPQTAGQEGVGQNNMQVEDPAKRALVDTKKTEQEKAESDRAPLAAPASEVQYVGTRKADEEEVPRWAASAPKAGRKEKEWIDLNPTKNHRPLLEENCSHEDKIDLIKKWLHMNQDEVEDFRDRLEQHEHKDMTKSEKYEAAVGPLNLQLMGTRYQQLREFACFERDDSKGVG